MTNYSGIRGYPLCQFLCVQVFLDDIGYFNPSYGPEHKAVQSGLFSKPVEFDGFKVRIMKFLSQLLIGVKQP